MLETPPQTVQDRLRCQLTRDLIRLWNLDAWRVLGHRVDRDEVSERWVQRLAILANCPILL